MLDVTQLRSRRALLATTASLAGATALAACGAGADSAAPAQPSLTKDNITLTWASPGDQAELDVYIKVAEQFTQKYPNIKVVNDAAASSRDKMTALLASDSSPEIIFRTINEFPAFVLPTNVWTPLDDLIKRDKFDLQDFFPQIIKPYRHDGKRFGEGKLYGLPKEIAIRSMFYNVDHFAEAGIRPPTSDQAWTWDEFRNAARRLNKPDGSRYAYSMETGWFYWAIWAWANGGEVVDDPWSPTKGTMDTPAVIEGMQYWADFLAKERVAPPLSAYSELSRPNHFAQGRASFYNNGRWNVPNFRRSQFKWDVMQMPKQKQRAQFLSGSSFGVAKSSKYPNESWELLKFISGTQAQNTMTDMGLLFPSRMSIAKSDKFLKSTPPTNNDVYLKDVEVARILPMHPRYPDMEREVNGLIAGVLNGTTTASAAGKEMTDKVNVILKG
ncbi:MAG TPA: sugar ABC transporter substrate-binding protein [Chloroflexota bacterium]|nr:sugar ABC transporter substrate-binding protein [Chloroflexota bacterium]